MARTVMTKPQAFTPRLLTKVYIITGPVAAADHKPTRAELEASTTIDVTKAVADMSGWSVTTSDIEVPALGSGFTSTIPGKDSAADSSLTFYADLAGTGTGDVRTYLDPLDYVHVVFMDGGDVPTQLGRVYPAQVKSVSVMPGGVDATAANRIVVGFSIWDSPVEKYAIPALT